MDGWCSLRAMRQILFCMFFLVAASARAQLPAAPAPAPPAPAASARLTPAEAQSLLDVLNDPQKRAALTASLQSLVKATNAPAPPKPAPAVDVPLAPNSVGAQVIAQSSTWFAELTGQFSAFKHVLGNLPAVWAFTRRTVTDPDVRAAAVDAAWHLAVVIAAAFLVQWAFGRVLRQPVAFLARMAPGGAVVDPPPAAAGDGTARRQRHFARTLLALRRLPFILARLVLDLLPVAIFLLLAWLGLNFLRPESRDALWVAVLAFAGARVTVAVVRAAVSPEHRSLRLIQLPGDGPAYTVRWTRRLVAVAAFGYAASTIGGLFGMPDPARQAFIKAVALVDHVLLVMIVLQVRQAVADAIHRAGGEMNWRGAISARLAALWHIVAIFFIVGLWLVWAAQVRHGYARMWRLFLLTAGILFVMRVIGVMLLGALDRLFHVVRDPSHFSGPQGRAGFYYALLRRVVTVLLWVIAAIALLQVWGLQLWRWFHSNRLGTQLASAAATILVAGLICLLVWEASNSALDRNLGRLRQGEHLARAARLRTLMPILRTHTAGRAGGRVRADRAVGNRRQRRAAAGRRRHSGRGDRLRQPEAGAGFHHRHFPAAGEYAMQVGDNVTRGGAFGLGRNPVDPHHAAARRRWLGAHHPVQQRHHGDQRQSRHRQRAGFSDRAAGRRHRSCQRCARRHCARHARRATVFAT